MKKTAVVKTTAVFCYSIELSANHGAEVVGNDEVCIGACADILNGQTLGDLLENESFGVTWK